MHDASPMDFPYVTLRFHAAREKDVELISRTVERLANAMQSEQLEKLVHLQVNLPLDISAPPFSSEGWEVGLTGRERDVYYLNGFMAGVPFEMDGQPAVVLSNHVVSVLYNFQFTTQVRVFMSPELIKDKGRLSYLEQWLCEVTDSISHMGRLAGVGGHPDAPRLQDVIDRIDTTPPLREFSGTDIKNTPLWCEAKGHGLTVSNHLHHSYQRAVDMLSQDPDTKKWGVTDVAIGRNGQHSFSLNLSYLMDNHIKTGHLVLGDGKETVPVWHMDIDTASCHMTIAQLVGAPVIKTVSQWRDAVEAYNTCGFFNADKELIWLDFLVMSALEYADDWVEAGVVVLREPESSEFTASMYSVVMQDVLMLCADFETVMAYMEALISMPIKETALQDAQTLASHFKIGSVTPRQAH